MTKAVIENLMSMYDKDLLKKDFVFGDSLKKERRLLVKAINFFKSKRMSDQKRIKCEKIISELEVLYEQAIEKEMQKTEAGSQTQRPFYYIKMPRKTDANIYFGFRSKRIRNSI